jgi:peptidyl-tRNA hydrolase, PTH1 family
MVSGRAHLGARTGGLILTGMKLLLGLGNLGDRYASTRHNLGFMIVDELARQLGATWRTETKFKADLAETQLADGGRLLLAKPHTMMNLSGQTAQKLAAFYKLAPDDVWAVYDELDLPFGRLRLRIDGSGGGHQGANSLIQHLGSNFTRARVGISLNNRSQESSEVYVLKPFNADEKAQLPHLIRTAADVLREQLAQERPAETTFDLLEN